MEKTKGEILRNNWNSINDEKGVNRSCRINFHNRSSVLTQKDLQFYMDNMWNEKAEKFLKITP